MYRIATYIFLTSTIVYLTLFFALNRERFLRPYDYSYFGKLYSESQYVKGGASIGGIGDDGLYAFAGWYYLTGGDISRVSFESPPLAKYAIGLSILFFGNELAINIIYAFLLVVIVYRLAFELLGSELLSAAATLLTTTNRLLTTQYLLSLTDLPMTILFLGGVLFLLIALRKRGERWSLFVSALLFSLSFTTRFFPILPIILFCLVVFLRLLNKPYWFRYARYLLILFPVIYLAVHIVYFRYHSLADFWHYQSWILQWRLGEPFVPGNLLTVAFTGYYRSWWGEQVWLFRDDWSLSLALVSILGTVGMWLWRVRLRERLITIITACYLVYAATLTVGVTKFLLPVFPFLVIAAISVTKQVAQKLSAAVI